MSDKENMGDFDEVTKKILNLLNGKGGLGDKIKEEFIHQASNTSCSMSKDFDTILDYARSNDDLLVTSAMPASRVFMDVIRSVSESMGGGGNKSTATDMAFSLVDPTSQRGEIALSTILLSSALLAVQSMIFDRLRKIKATKDIVECPRFNINDERLLGSIHETLRSTTFLLKFIDQLGFGLTQEAIGKLKIEEGYKAIKDRLLELKAQQ